MCSGFSCPQGANCLWVVPGSQEGSLLPQPWEQAEMHLVLRKSRVGVVSPAAGELGSHLKHQAEWEEELPFPRPQVGLIIKSLLIFSFNSQKPWNFSMIKKKIMTFCFIVYGQWLWCSNKWPPPDPVLLHIVSCSLDLCESKPQTRCSYKGMAAGLECYRRKHLQTLDEKAIHNWNEIKVLCLFMCVHIYWSALGRLPEGGGGCWSNWPDFFF